MNSSAIGCYVVYLTCELIPYVHREFRTLASREHRGCFGKSSGGYGAIMHAMRYAQHWGAIADHSGDALFDFCYYTDWPRTLNELDRYRRRQRSPGRVDVAHDERDAAVGIDDGRVKRFLEHVWAKDKLADSEVHALMNLAMAATYDPDPKVPLGFRLPFNLETGELIRARWRRWLANDPVNLVASCKRNLKSMGRLDIDCGWRAHEPLHKGARPPATDRANPGAAHAFWGRPGSGAKMAARSVEYRQKNGPFKKSEDLMNVQGVGEKNFLKLKPQLSIAPAKADHDRPNQR